MIYNYHTHTTRCHHAIDSDEEYIESAIAAGIKYLGFSDHAPFVFPDGHEAFYCVEEKDCYEYVQTIHSLAEKYKEKILINVGYEMEYYPEHFEKMLELARNSGAEYLILGQHCITHEYPKGHGSRGYTEDESLLGEYVDNVVDGIKSGVFSYVAHPDIINFGGSEDAYYNEMTRLCRVAKEHNIPLEINLHGLVNKRHYPSDRFFALVGEIGTPVVFGYDAHDSAALLNKEIVAEAGEMVKRHRLNYIGMPRLIPIK